MTEDLARAAELLPERFAGPGGAFAVLRAGVVLENGAWGWADRERRIPFTPATATLVCSITKQFTCATLLGVDPDPGSFAPLLRARLPHLEAADRPTVETLCHNQSGLRDYWALAMLCGAPVEGRFDEASWRRLIDGTRSLQFAPGTRYSYSNGNFRLLSDMLEERTGRPFEELLRAGILDRAGMGGARLAPETGDAPGGVVGYEGDVATGFRPALNRIRWTGDAALAASLDDMIAWERFIDRTTDDPSSVYESLAAPVAFSDGAPAPYGYGLARSRMRGRPITGHAGGLRGFRSFRLRSAADRISVVVLFNHMADARAAADTLFGALIGAAADEPGDGSPDPPFSGRFVDGESGLATRIERRADGTTWLHHSGSPEALRLQPDGSLAGPVTTLTRSGEIVMRRRTENLAAVLRPAGMPGAGSADMEGVFRNAELEATLLVVRSGRVFYGAFSGFLGEGSMEQLVPYGEDLVLLPCPRALDFGAPGDWTLRAVRNETGKVTSIVVGCWLARCLPFERVG